MRTTSSEFDVIIPGQWREEFDEEDATSAPETEVGPSNDEAALPFSFTSEVLHSVDAPNVAPHAGAKSEPSSSSRPGEEPAKFNTDPNHTLSEESPSTDIELFPFPFDSEPSRFTGPAQETAGIVAQSPLLSTEPAWELNPEASQFTLTPYKTSKPYIHVLPSSFSFAAEQMETPTHALPSLRAIPALATTTPTFQFNSVSTESSDDPPLPLVTIGGQNDTVSLLFSSDPDSDWPMSDLFLNEPGAPPESGISPTTYELSPLLGATQSPDLQRFLPIASTPDLLFAPESMADKETVSVDDSPATEEPPQNTHISLFASEVRPVEMTAGMQEITSGFEQFSFASEHLENNAPTTPILSPLPLSLAADSQPRPETRLNTLVALARTYAQANPDELATKRDVQNLMGLVSLMECGAKQDAHRPPDRGETPSAPRKAYFLGHGKRGIRVGKVPRLASRKDAQKKIRHVFRTLMKRDFHKKSRIPEASVASVSEVTAFEKGYHTGPTEEEFKVQLGSKRATTWNHRAVQLVVTHVYDSGWSSFANRTDLEKMAQKHISQISSAWDAQQRAERGPSIDDIDARSIANQLQRRIGLSNRRVAIIEEVEQMWRFRDFWRIAPWTVHSGDESDGDGNRIVKRIDWRSKELENHCIMLDRFYLWDRHRRNSFLDTGAGAFPQYRIRSGNRKQYMQSEAPKGLPLNCYDREWLLTLSKSQYLELAPTPPIDFTPTAKELEISREYQSIRSREDLKKKCNSRIRTLAKQK